MAEEVGREENICKDQHFVVISTEELRLGLLRPASTLPPNLLGAGKHNVDTEQRV